MPIKTFRGLLADGAIDTVTLHTNNGSAGYRIVKMDLMSSDPMDTATKADVKIYKTPQTAVTNAMDFSDQTLLAAGHHAKGNNTSEVVSNIIVFDNVVFNQDIFVTAIDTQATEPINYYIELEQMPLDLSEQTVATLKDIRNVGAE